jgi:hypothetical protein
MVAIKQAPVADLLGWPGATLISCFKTTRLYVAGRAAMSAFGGKAVVEAMAPIRSSATSTSPDRNITSRSTLICFFEELARCLLFNDFAQPHKLIYALV